MAEKHYVGADHVGFNLKNRLVDELKKLGYEHVLAREVVSDDRRPLYYLVFASKSLTAATFWEKISGDDEQPTLF